MGDSIVPPTSEEQMNKFRLRDKMNLLNSEFIKVIQHFYDEKAHYDFTSTMQSYIEHVKSLRSMYKVNDDTDENSTKNAPIVSNPSTEKLPVQRKMLKAARKNTPVTKSTTTSTFASSSPAVIPPTPNFGNISRIPSSTPATIEKAPSDPAPPAGRKRAIRGGGPLGGSESVIFKTGEIEKSTVKLSGPEIKLPTPTPDFWKKKETTNSDAPNGGGSLFGFLKEDDNSTKKFTGFSFGKGNEEKQSEVNDKETSSPKLSDSNSKSTGSTSTSFSMFGKSTESSGVKFPSFGDKLNNSFGKEEKSGSEKPLSFPSFGKSTESSTKQLSFPSFGKADSSSESSSKPSSFLNFGQSTTESNPSSKLSFPSFGSKPAESGLGSTPLTFGAPGGGLFANLTKQAAENSAAATEGANDNDEAEYVPPKVETVENEEPDAVFSSKVSVFKFVDSEYKKLGVGMLHIKETDGKSSVLIRAATATGTVWLNSLCNAAMKASKIDEKKIRLTCPATATEMSTMAIRFATEDLASKCAAKIEEFTSKK
ncbi:unnamed protein product [Caenorhabditis angaria]|uniref:RanBD1 domain-containing protein n=1 Tax=Caenorhabditis angaria TaxID=860376 RepID=A0A9P1N1B9_9PELO|nr:unnamed protein product [Caenorhabditis angaria]